MLVEDDDRIRLSLTLALEDEGYEVSGFATAEQALTSLANRDIDAVLVDLMLPGMTGLDCIRHARKLSDVPIVVVSARDDTHDVVAALEAGADDYVVKPVAVKELAARLRAMRRRLLPLQPVPTVRVLGNLEVDPAAGEVRVDGRDVALTRTEFRLLCELADHSGQVLSRRQLLARVWGHEFGDERVVDVQVGRLRRKIEADPASPEHVITMRGLGYKLR
jgi:two-component system, OmpR family, response regulator RegX3